jgi:hypothetical protein
VNIVEYACQMQDAKLAALKAQAQVPTIEAFKKATRAAVEDLELFTHFEKKGLIGEIEDAWARLEAGNAHQ